MTKPNETDGLRKLALAFKALTFDEMMEAADMVVEILKVNKGPIVKPSTMAETLNDLLDALED